MIINNRALNALDALFIIADRVEQIDYIAIGERVIDKAIITAAVIYGVATYIITALQLFWLQHGDFIMAITLRFIINTADYCHELYQMGADFRRFITKTFGFITDRLYYSAIA